MVDTFDTMDMGDWADEHDLVLTVPPPVPRRVPGSIGVVSQPAVVPPPSSLPPPVPAAGAASAVAAPPEPAGAPEPAVATVVESGDDETTRRWPDRRWWTSTGVSLVVHVVVLTILALIVAVPELIRRQRPIEIAQRADDQEPMPFLDPEELVVEVLEPAEMPVVEPVEQAVALVDDEAVDVAGTAFEAEDATAGLVELAADGMLARIGGGGAGQAVGGFGGDVGRRLARAGAKTGDIQVSLAWNNFNDIDLHVVVPSGEYIYFGHRMSNCRGQLDVDMNATGPVSREPVENVFWPKRTAPRGEYRVFVHHYARYDRAADDTPFEVHVLVNGSRRRYTGSVKSGDPPLEVIAFEKGADEPVSDEFVE